MSTTIIVMGAKGRMGTMIANMVKADPEAELAGVVERKGCDEGLDAYGCLCGTELAAMLEQCPDAVVIDFTAPAVSVADARACVAAGNPIVIGTTGLDDAERAELEELAKTGLVFWASNMSVGVNVLLKVLPELVKKLGPDYSGTALKLAECLAEARDWDLKEVGAYCREGIIGARPQKEIGVQTIRGGDVVGVHTMYFMGPGERIEVTHQAHSRENFAAGSLRAAKWLVGQKPGKLYTMTDTF